MASSAEINNSKRPPFFRPSKRTLNTSTKAATVAKIASDGRFAQILVLGSISNAMEPPRTANANISATPDLRCDMNLD